MRYPLVDGQGNFGSIDGDPPAAMRYTEARLEALAEAMMADLDKETVDFVPNYDETTEEPTVLPTPFPNLLVNGSAGIAVGMATNIPPHNMREVIDGVIAVIEQRAAQSDESRLDEAVAARPSPVPTSRPAAIIVGRARHLSGLHDRAAARSRCAPRPTIEERKKGDRVSIVVTEIPYQVNKARLIEKHRRAGPREDDRRHLRPPRRIRSRRHADRHRAEARRSARGRPEQPLQAHAAADDVRHHHAGDRRRPAEGAAAARGHRALHRVPARGRPAPDRVRAAQGRGARPHPRRPARSRSITSTR